MIRILRCTWIRLTTVTTAAPALAPQMIELTTRLTTARPHCCRCTPRRRQRCSPHPVRRGRPSAILAPLAPSVPSVLAQRLHLLHHLQATAQRYALQSSFSSGTVQDVIEYASLPTLARDYYMTEKPFSFCMQGSVRSTSSRGSSLGAAARTLSPEEQERLAHLRQMAEEDSEYRVHVS